MKLEEFLRSNHVPFEKNLPLASFTKMNLAGVLDCVARPVSIGQLVLLYQYVQREELSYEIIGSITNTYLCEGIKRDVFIQTTSVCEIDWRENEIEVGCGYNLTKLAVEISKLGGANYEGFIGIPGTVGAAVINNSGAFNCEMSKVVKCVRVINKIGEEIILYNGDLLFDVRNSILKNHLFGVLLSVTLDISKKEDEKVIDCKVSKIREERKRRREWDRKNLGSIFVGKSINTIWKLHPWRNIIRKLLYSPFKYTQLRQKAQCFSEFAALGGLRFFKYCNNIGWFCWSNDTVEKDFLAYIDFVKRASKNNARLEIDIKR